jgi:prepilin-type N-terminal cleavage/methylation domain-containing protein
MKQGFSLLELAVVLVVIGLVTGGILEGRSLVRGAELRSISRQYTQFVAGATNFRDKYNALPGDMTDATTYWGDNNTYCPDGNPNGSPGTCNGNGNLQIDIPAIGPPVTGEMFQFWNQLSLGGFIEGTYTGISLSNGGASSSFVNSPDSKFTNVGWSVNYRSNGDPAIFFATGSGNILQIGGNVGTSSFYSPFLQPSEAESVDRKMDDGMPSSGIVTGVTWSACTNANNNTSETATYLVSSSDTVCALVFPKPF